MELLQLQYFKTIAECQHITKAANLLMVSQPSLSNTLSRIEAELGVQLFDRQGRNIVLNHYGKILLEHTNNILRELDNIQTEIGEMEHQQNNTIAIASTDSMYLREWLPAFIKENPDLSIRHSVATPEKIKAALLDGTIDFGISSVTFDNSALAHHQLWEDEYMVATPLPNAFPNGMVRDFTDFKQEPFVALPAIDSHSRYIDILSNAAGFRPNIIFEGERELLERVMIPLHASIIILRSTMQNENDEALYSGYCSLSRLSNPEAHIRISLSWDARRTRTTAAQRLLDYIQNTPLKAWHLTTPDEVWDRRNINIKDAQTTGQE